MNHTVTLYRDDNRLGQYYGQHYYIERMNGTTIKVERLDWQPFDQSAARNWGRSVARTYGATFVDCTPPACLYGWSAD